MSTAACPRCGRTIPAVAVFCPKCGVSMTGGLVFDYATQPIARRRWGAIAFAGLVIVVVILAMLFVVGSAPVAQSPTQVAPMISGR